MTVLPSSPARSSDSQSEPRTRVPDPTRIGPALETELIPEIGEGRSPSGEVTDEAGRGASTGQRRVDLATTVFAVLGVLVGVVFIAINPPFWGNDGMSQFARAYQVSRGDLLPVPIEWGDKGQSFGGEIPAAAWQLYLHASTDLGSNPAEPAPLVNDPAEYDRLTSMPFNSPEKNVVWFTNTAAYSPVPYVPAAVGSLLGQVLSLSVGTSLTLMALASLLAYLIPVALALIALRRSRLQWLVFSVALIPPALLQASTLTADALTNGLAIAFFAIFAKAVFLRRPLARWELTLFSMAALLLPLCKPTYFVVTVLVAFMPASIFGSGARGQLVKWLPVGIGLVLWAGWTIVSSPTSSTLAFYRRDYMTSEFGLVPQLLWTIQHPVEFVEGVSRTFFYRDNFFFLDLIGSSNIRVPSLSSLMGVFTIALALGISEKLLPTRPQRIAFLTVVGLSVVAIFATLFISFTPVGYYLVDGVQGRYFFPLLPYIGATVLLATGVRFGTDDRGALRVQVTIASMAAVALLTTLAKVYFVFWG